jgi:autotransporter translocation and assembly factor TamB
MPPARGRRAAVETPPARPPHRRLRLRGLARGLVYAALGLTGLLVVGLAAATVLLQGPRLARLVGGFLPTFAGKLEVAGISWQPRLFMDLLRDRPTPIVVEGLRITDPEGVDVLRAPRLELKVRPRAAIGLKIYLSDVKLGQGSYWRFAKMKTRDEIGFLQWFRIKEDEDAPRPPPPPKQEPDEGGFVFQIVNADLDGLTAEFDFPGAWGLVLRDVKSPASLLIEGSFVGWDAAGLVARKGGSLTILTDVLPFDRVEVTRVATTRAWPDNIFLDVAAAHTGRARLTAKGMFTGIYGYGVPPGAPGPPSGIDLRAHISDAADALAAVAAGRNIAGLRIAGEAASVDAHLHDAFERLKIDGRIAGLDVSYDSYQARRLGMEFALDLGEPMSVVVSRLGFEAPGGGALALEASLRGTRADARLRFNRLTTDSYLPAGLRKLGAGVLHGGFRVSADLATKALELEGMNLSLRRRFSAGAPRSITVLGQARASRDAASTRGVVIKVPGATVTASGRFGLAHQVLGLGLRAVASDLPRLLATLGVPPYARSADLAVDVGGTVTAPEGKGTVTVRGIGLPGLPPIGVLAAAFSLQGGTARLDSLTADAFGGQLRARGSARLWNGTLARMLKQPVIELRLDGRQIELATLVAGGAISGRVDVQASVEGPLDAWRADVRLPPGAELVVLGQRWRLDGIELFADARGAEVRAARLRGPGSGRVELRGRLAYAGEMQWDVSVVDLPLAALPGVADAGVAAEGRLSLQLAMLGTVARPQLRGVLQLRDVSLRGARLGNGTITFTPTEEGGVAAKGELFGRITLAGTASYSTKGARVKATAAFNDLILEQLVPEMAALGDARGRVSGNVDLEMGGANPLTVDLRLRQLELSAAREGDLGGPARPAAGKRLFLRNAVPVRVVLAGNHLIVDRTRLVTDGGEFKLWGELRDDLVTAEVDGSLNLELVQPFIADRVDSLGGQVDLALRIAGTPKRPLGEGSLVIARPIVARLPGVGPPIAIPTGVIKLSPTSLVVKDLAIEAEKARLTLAGRAGFDDKQRVTAMDLAVNGEISGALIEALAGAALSDATGRARIEGRLTGTPDNPQVKVDVDLGGLTFRVRDLGQELAFERGRVSLRQDALLLNNIEARVDGQGRLLIAGKGGAPGKVAIRRLRPTLDIGQVDIPLRGQRLSLRVSDAVELDDLGFDLAVTGSPDRGFAVAGEVLVASGRYGQDFAVRNLILSPTINESDARPFYYGKPLLEDLALNLRVRTVGDSFTVQNNLAPELHMAFELLVRGTLSQPRIAGDVRPTDGRFHILGLRGDFSLVPNVNHITFVDTKSIERGETPELNLEAESPVTDSFNQEHLVRMRISGPIGQAEIDLTTDTHLDRNQAMLLLISGRTSQEETVFGGTRNPTLGTNVRTGTDVIDQLARDSVSTMLEPYIDDTLQLLTGGKLNLRPTVGPEGFEVRLGKTGRQWDFQLSLLRGLDSRRQYKGETRLWLRDYVTARGRYENITYTPQEGIIENRTNLKLELGWDWPIRWDGFFR